MNTLVVIFALIAVACAKPVDQGVSLTQDTLGNYNLQYRTLDSSRTEKASQDGKVVGSYSYTDKEGTIHTIKYIASDAGFFADGDVPRQVTDTPEVAAARLAHLAVVEKTRALLPLVPEVEEEKFVEVTPFSSFNTVPVVKTVEFLQAKPKVIQVDNTREIEAAKAEHYAAHQRALANLASEYRRIAA